MKGTPNNAGFILSTGERDQLAVETTLAGFVIRLSLISVSVATYGDRQGRLRTENDRVCTPLAKRQGSTHGKLILYFRYAIHCLPLAASYKYE